MSKETIGKKALELQSKNESHDSIELQREIHKGNTPDDSFESQVSQCVARGRQFIDGDFYVEVQVKKERLLQNVVRQYFIPKRACPTPQFDQMVYRYRANLGDLEFLWVIPDWVTVERMVNNPFDVHPEHMDLLRMCLDFKSGDLDRKAKMLNNELTVIS